MGTEGSALGIQQGVCVEVPGAGDAARAPLASRYLAGVLTLVASVEDKGALVLACGEHSLGAL